MGLSYQLTSLLFLGITPQHALAGGTGVILSYPEGLLPQLAERVHTDSCWVRYQIPKSAEISNDSTKSICIPEALWRKYLSPRGSWRGVWKASSHPLLGTHTRKQIILTFYSTKRISPSVQVQTPIGQLLEQSIEQIELLREYFSSWLSSDARDSLGIYAQILLGESHHDGPSRDDLRILGLGRALNLSALYIIPLFSWIELAVGRIALFYELPSFLALILVRTLSFFSLIWSYVLAGGPRITLRVIYSLLLRSILRMAGVKISRSRFVFILLFVDMSFGCLLCFVQGKSLLVELRDPARMAYVLLIAHGILNPRKDHGSLKTLFFIWTLVSLMTSFQSQLLSLGSLLVGLTLLPWLGLVVYPALFLRSFSPFPISQLLHLNNALILNLCSGLSKLPLLWHVPLSSLFVSFGIASMLWMLPTKLRTQWALAFATLITIAGLNFPESKESQTHLDFADRVVQLDVGQGDAALILAGLSTDHPLVGMIDSGSGREISATRWLEFFSRSNIERINWIALTHLDEDHSGGVLKISEVIPIDCVTTSSSELRSARGKDYQEKLLSRGIQVFSSLKDCIPFPALPPSSDQLYDPKNSPSGHLANENMSSFLIPLRGGGFYLSAGDATQTAELRIGRWARETAEKLENGPRILKISHHGSKTSTHPEFIKELSPTELWISDGVGNRYGHPANEVIERLEKLNVPIHRTDQEGALFFQSSRKTPAEN